VSQLPTCGTVGGYLAELLRQGYLAAWGMLTRSHGQEAETAGAVLADDGLGGFDTQVGAVEAKSAGSLGAGEIREARRLKRRW
jgi:hypothetical protein